MKSDTFTLDHNLLKLFKSKNFRFIWIFCRLWYKFKERQYLKVKAIESIEPHSTSISLKWKESLVGFRILKHEATEAKNKEYWDTKSNDSINKICKCKWQRNWRDYYYAKRLQLN